jgi:hypothetical protein
MNFEMEKYLIEIQNVKHRQAVTKLRFLRKDYHAFETVETGRIKISAKFLTKLRFLRKDYHAFETVETGR